MPNETKIKLKNEQPDGAGLKLQFWNGQVPNHNTDAQKAAALSAHAVNVEGNREAPAETAPVESLPEGYDKLKKAELVELATARKGAGKDIAFDETDTVATLREKIEATYPAAAFGEVAAENKAAADSKIDYDFSAGNLLQEISLSVGEEKVFGLASGQFLTIKIDE